MKYFLSISLLLLCSNILFGQKETIVEKGTVTYVSSQNVYVKFSSTEHINKGDTLFSKKGEQLLPSLVVKDKSSTSCVCTALSTEKAKLGDEFYSKSIVEKKAEKTKEKKSKPFPAGQDSMIKPPPVVIAPQDDKDDDAYKQKVKGRISAASYSNFYGEDQIHRMRYALVYQGNNLGNSRISTENYITFRHTIGEWNTVKENFNDAFKIYSLSVKYDLDKTSSISLGRKINHRISSMGAIDGLQVEKGLKHFLVGAIVGSRPHFADYSINLNLFQVGAYVGHVNKNPIKRRETTFAVVEQRNHSKTDRRFVYFQHSNSLSKNLNLFGSFEVDMYQVVNEQVSNSMSLTNLLLTLRYKISKKLSISASYDNRKNIIYYESYKSYIDQLIEDETRQGLRFGVNYRILKRITWGANASWRFQKSNINLSKNINTYVNFSRLPWVNATASLSANLLQTNYLDSRIYGARLSKELVRGKLNSEVYYRWVEYDYKNYEYKIRQQIGGIDFSWNITRKLALYLYYEGTFDKQNKTFNRFNTKLIQRF
ncbi:MAG: hypothetical protein IPH31_27165 [Lewinellaceae bacterium]|nr:hypothetical protein [Lewinellaceae bacterium]